MSQGSRVSYDTTNILKLWPEARDLSMGNFTYFRQVIVNGHFLKVANLIGA
jgi:hypothetical protein